MKRLLTVLLVVALAGGLAGCASQARQEATPTADESVVPQGMPVMYEFFTET